MSVENVCDGCNATESQAGSLERHGIMTPLDYCPRCSSVVVRYLQARDELHEEIARNWEKGTQALRDEVMAAHPNLRLPDDF